MEDNVIPEFKIKRHTVLRRLGTSTTALMVFAAQVTPALATIDNTGTATGTYSGTNYNASSTANVPVTPAAGSMTVVKSIGSIASISGGADNTITDAGDTIGYKYTIQNTGNVTLTLVSPTDPGPKFNGVAGSGTMGAFTGGTATLAPGATTVFLASYTLSALDVDRAAGTLNGVSNTASATSKTPGGATVTPGSSSTITTTIAAGPKLSMVKTFAIADIVAPGNTAGKADVGETVTYTFTVSNVGNVAMTNITVADFHFGSLIPAGSVTNETLVSDGPLLAGPPAGPASTDATINNATWSVLQPGAVVKFTWSHVVTQAEFDAG